MFVPSLSWQIFGFWYNMAKRRYFRTVEEEEVAIFERQRWHGGLDEASVPERRMAHGEQDLGLGVVPLDHAAADGRSDAQRTCAAPDHVVRARRHRHDAAGTSLFSSKFPYVCPEPILTNILLLSLKITSQKGRCRTCRTFPASHQAWHPRERLSRGASIRSAWSDPIRKRHSLFLGRLPYVCPEPVLAK